MGCFMIPLGGGNEVGASAYFLSIDGMKILLDCGARRRGEELYPDYEWILREISDFSEIDAILISHGHYDHIGSFVKIALQASNAEIVTTDETKKLIYLQLLSLGRISGRAESDRVKNEKYRLAQAIMPRIRVMPAGDSFSIKGCRITFFPAGHMLGAVMIGIETPNYRILYSGDFSVRTMFGINGMKLMEKFRPNTLLLNAPNLYLDRAEWDSQRSCDEKEGAESDHYLRLREIIRRKRMHQKKVYLISRSIPKHLDLFYFLNTVFPDVLVGLEKKSRTIADALSDMGYSIYGKTISPSESALETCDVAVGQEASRPGFETVFFDQYSLHASASETLEFVRQTGASEVYLLHVYPRRGTVPPAEMIRMAGSAASVCQTVNGEKYYIKRGKDMLHETIFREVMQKELIKAHEEEGNIKRLTVEWASIYGSLRYPDRHQNAAYKSLQSTFVGTRRISYEEYKDALRSANLDTEEKRRYVLSLVEEGVTLLKKALDGDRRALERYAAFTEDLEPIDRKSRKRFFIGKCVVVFLILIDPDLKSEEYRPIATTFGARYCDRLLRTIRDRLLKEYGMTFRRRTAKDVLLKTERALTESNEAAARFSSGDELEQLRFMNNNYKNSLELVQAMLDELNETIEETAADAKHSAIASFYSNMNSEDYGNLLDSIEVVERRLASLRENKFRIPPQLLPLTIVFKQLLKFVKDCDITPIEETGRVFEAEVEQLADYTYIGEAYTYPGEKKTVVVERPGWKFDSVVISLPTVREKEEGSIE